MRHFRAGKGVVNALTFTPCGRTLHCVESKDLHAPHEAVHWLDVERGQLARTLDLREDAWRQAVSYGGDAETGNAFVSPDGRWVAVERYIGADVVLDLWHADANKWRELDLIEGSVVNSVCFDSTSSLMLFSISTDGGATHDIERVELTTFNRVPTYRDTSSSVCSLCLSASGDRLGAASFGSASVIFSSGKLVRLAMEIADERTLRFHPRGNELAIVDGDRVFLWDCQSPDAVQVPDVDDGITDLTFAPDGELWALGYTDGTVRLRTREREVARFDWGIGRVASVAFAPDGLTCAAGGENGQIVLWDVDV